MNEIPTYRHNGGHFELVLNKVPGFQELPRDELKNVDEEALYALMAQSLPAGRLNFEALFTIVLNRETREDLETREPYESVTVEGTTNEDQLRKVLGILNERENRYPWVAQLQAMVFRSLVADVRTLVNSTTPGILTIYEETPAKYLEIIQKILNHWDTIISYISFMFSPQTLASINQIIDLLASGQVVDSQDPEFRNFFAEILFIYQAALLDIEEHYHYLRDTAGYLRGVVIPRATNEADQWGEYLTPELVDEIRLAIRKLMVFDFLKIENHARPTVSRLNQLSEIEQARMKKEKAGTDQQKDAA